MKKHFIISLILIFSFLNACSDNEETIKFEDKNFANTLIVQKVVDNASTDDMQSIITEKNNINKTLSLVEGLTAKKIDMDTFSEKMKSQDFYMFGFLKGDGTTTEQGAYAFNILEDGTILYNYDNIDNPQYSLISTEKHEDILNEFKQVLGVDFKLLR